MKTFKILHLLSQRPDSTGSGIYIQAMMREARAWGDDNFLVAGVCSEKADDAVFIEHEDAVFVNFNCAEIAYQIPGMSDVMPYESARFCDLSEMDLRNYQRAFTQALRRTTQKFTPDIIHSHHLWIVSALVRKLLPNIPMVTSCHGSDLRQFQNCTHLQEMVLEGCRGINHILALTAAQKSEIIRLYGLPPERITVVGAGYNDSMFYLDQKPRSTPVQLVYAGKLSNAKGVPWFLQALQSIDAPAWELHLLGGGSGEEKAHCLRLADKLGEKIHVHGALPQAQLATIVRRSHILVLPSFYEGLPLVVLEGLASGCRIVVTDLPGTREILGDLDSDFITMVPTPRLHAIDQPFQQDEELFEQNLKDALQQQIVAAAKHPQIDLAPIRTKLDAYTWSGIFKQVRDVYLRSTKGRPKP